MVLEETRRQKELLCKMEREKTIEIENLQARWAEGGGAWAEPAGLALHRPPAREARCPGTVISDPWDTGRKSGPLD